LLPQGGDQAANCGDEEGGVPCIPERCSGADWWHAAWDESVPCIPERCSGAASGMPREMGACPVSRNAVPGGQWHAAWDGSVPCIPERCSGADWWYAGLNETGKRDLLRVANRAAFAKRNLLLLDMG